MEAGAGRPRVLVIDDLAEQLRGSLDYIADEYAFEYAVRGSEGLHRLREDRAEGGAIFAVLLDNKFNEPEFAAEPMFEGREILHQVLALENPPLVVMVSAYEDTDTVVECVQAGAFWYLAKPLDADRVRELLRRGFAHWKLTSQNRALRREYEWRTREAEVRSGVLGLPDFAERRSGFGHLLGASERMQALYRLVLRFGPTDLSFLILGERGSGKESLAREIHRVSPRREGPFLAFSCNGEESHDRMLFGWVCGAGESAAEARHGVLEACAGGTLLLRDIERLGGEQQGRLLEAIRSGAARRYGESRERALDVRLLASSRARLRELREEGSFDEDLFFRLAQEVAIVPALRDRKADLAALAEHFLARAGEHLGAEEVVVARSFHPQVFEKLEEHDWPGNVAELRDLVVDLARRAPTTVISADLVAFRDPDLGHDELQVSERARRCYAEAVERGGAGCAIVEFRNRHGEDVLREVLQLALEHTGHRGKSAGQLLGWIGAENERRDYDVFRKWLARLGVSVRARARGAAT